MFAVDLNNLFMPENNIWACILAARCSQNSDNALREDISD